MERREFVKLVPLTALAGTAGLSSEAQAANAQAVAAAGDTQVAGSKDEVRQLLSKKPGMPKYTKNLPIRQTDMDGIGPDGKPIPGYKAVGTGSPPKLESHDPKKPHQMKLTKEEQDIMNGSKGPEWAKAMETVVCLGNVFGADELVDLGGNPHPSTFLGSPALKPIIELFAA